MSRKSLVAGLALVLTAGVQAEVDIGTREGVVTVSRKIQCSTQDEVEKTFVWHGRAYSRRQGERDRLLFGLLGMNVRQCLTITNDRGEEGYRLFGREVMLYLDPETGEILREWTNPWTGATVQVIHVANDPVNSRGDFGYGRDGKVADLSMRMIGDYWQMSREVPLFYHNVLAGDYQRYVGGTYHATEMFDFYGLADELLDGATTSVNPGVAWVRLSQWLPWMEMNGREGMLYFNAQGAKLDSWDQLPEPLKSELIANYPEYRNAPPVDDERPNETSWTYFKKVFDQRAEEADDEHAGGH